MHGGEIEVAVGQVGGERVRAGCGEGRDEHLQRHRLEGGRGGIGGDELIRIEGEGLLGLAVQRRGDDQQPAALIEAVL